MTISRSVNNSLFSRSVAGSKISSQMPENRSFTTSNLPLSLLHHAFSVKTKILHLDVLAGAEVRRLFCINISLLNLTLRVKNHLTLNKKLFLRRK